MNALKVVGINVLILVLLFASLEALVRWRAPEYANAWFTDTVTRGNPIYLSPSHGYRVPQDQRGLSLSRAGDEYRVLFIGDSVTFGYGLRYEDTFHAITATALRERGCPAAVFGIGRYGATLADLMTPADLAFMLEQYDADLIIYQFNPNDVDTTPAGRPADRPLTTHERFEKFRLSWLNRSALLKAVQSVSLRASQRRQGLALTDSLRYAPGSNPDLYHRRWQDFASTLDEFAARLEERGKALVVLAIPESFRVSASPLDNEFQVDTTGIAQWPEEKVAALLAPHGVPVLDALPAMQRYRAANPTVRLYFPNDKNHPNAAGHRVVAGVITDWLANESRVCPRVADG